MKRTGTSHMDRVALVNMPFATTTRPAIGISLLKAALERDGVACDLHYLNLRYAAQVGIERYEHICNINHTLLAEYVFALGLFGDKIPCPEEYCAKVFAPAAARADQGSPAAERIETLASWVRLLVEHAAIFLDRCMQSIPWGDYPLVGFTTTFHQTAASLALATRIKREWPEVRIIFGGANCEAEMGHALHRLFPVIDFLCSGEGDIAFPLLVQRLLRGQELGDIPGILTRQQADRAPALTAAAAPVMDMDALPIPNYDDYIEQRRTELKLSDPPELLIETARGCWWGRKSHCTFCGLNGQTMQFRAKSATRAYQEIMELARRYGVERISSVDNIIAMEYFHCVLPQLAASGLNLDLFYETKANLKRAQVRLLRESGILRIQPGIESLSTHVLKLMKKGVTSLQNLQLLRWCDEYMVETHWNLLAGFPGETAEDYQRQAQIVPLVVHLTPPLDCGLLRLDRFSPLFVNAQHHGLCNVRPKLAYGQVFPCAPEDLQELAYFFDFEYVDGRDPASYIAGLQQQVQVWKTVHASAALLSLCFDDRLVIWDTRPMARRREHWLGGRHRQVYELCDEARTLRSLHALSDRASGLEEALADLLELGLVLHEDDHFLSLGVAADYQLALLTSHARSGTAAPKRSAKAFSRLYSTAPQIVRGMIAAHESSERVLQSTAKQLPVS